jgi:hypothetical protein
LRFESATSGGNFDSCDSTTSEIALRTFWNSAFLVLVIARHSYTFKLSVTGAQNKISAESHPLWNKPSFRPMGYNPERNI